ncbi:hypothetical protein Drorol1_Dr00020805 [Drosera rotundifolia]
MFRKPADLVLLARLSAVVYLAGTMMVFWFTDALFYFAGLSSTSVILSVSRMSISMDHFGYDMGNSLWDLYLVSNIILNDIEMRFLAERHVALGYCMLFMKDEMTRCFWFLLNSYGDFLHAMYVRFSGLIT